MFDRKKLLVVAIVLIAATYYFGDLFLADKALKELQGDNRWVVVATGWGVLLEMWPVVILFAIPFTGTVFFVLLQYRRYLDNNKQVVEKERLAQERVKTKAMADEWIKNE